MCHRKLCSAFLFLIALVLAGNAARAGVETGVIRLVDNGYSSHAIVIDIAAPKVVRHAAAELVEYLNRMTTATLPIHERPLGDSTALVLWQTGSPLGTVDRTGRADLGTDGFVMQQEAGNLWIQAVGGRGVLYGVYALLEDLGCQWFSATAEYVPKRKDLVLEKRYVKQVPAFTYREVYYYDVADETFAAKMRLNGNAHSQGVRDGKRWMIAKEDHAGWGIWCHTFYQVLDPVLYGTNPEYFPWVDGNRIAPRHDGTQLCLSHPNIVPMMVNGLKIVMDNMNRDRPVWADPEYPYWSVSQNDGMGYCTCDGCHRLDSAEGSHIGSILHVVNQVADYFPDKKIGTLSYTYSRKPPKTIKPRPNVVIQLCNIETSRDGCNVPIERGALHRRFREDLNGWRAISDDILIWDYVVQFQNLVSPFPNFGAFKANINYYRFNHVSAVFLQGNREKGGEFAELRAYVLAKLLWNPEQDVDALINRFVHGYYGPAGHLIKCYIDTMHAELDKSGLMLSIDGEPESHRNGYLSEAMVKHYNALFDQAEARVADRKDLLLRVREARLPLMYAQLRLGYGDDASLTKLAAEFFDLAEQTELWMLSEVDFRSDQSGTREMFQEKLAQRWTK